MTAAGYAKLCGFLRGKGAEDPRAHATDPELFRQVGKKVGPVRRRVCPKTRQRPRPARQSQPPQQAEQVDPSRDADAADHGLSPKVLEHSPAGSDELLG